jgi:hypothetical protein
MDNFAALGSFTPVHSEAKSASTAVYETSQTTPSYFDGLTVKMRNTIEYFLIEPTSGEEVLKTLVDYYDPLLPRSCAPYSVRYYLDKEFGRVAVSLLITPGHDDVVDAIFSNLDKGLKLAREYVRKNVPASSRTEQKAMSYPPLVRAILMRIHLSYTFVKGRRMKRVGAEKARSALGLNVNALLTEESIEDAFSISASVLHYGAMLQDSPSKIITLL